MKLTLTLLIALLLAPLAALHAADNPEPKPNIILILADDLGAKELSCYGNKEHQTPNFDRMAAEGMRFEFMSTLANPDLAAGEARFKKLDANKDGHLTKEAILGAGGHE